MIELRWIAGADELREAHRTLLTGSFRAGELMHEEDFVAQFPDAARALVACDEDGRMLGLAVIEQFRDAALLQYLVASPRSRGQGVGSGLLTRIIETWATTGASLLLAEFDRPDAHTSHPRQGDPAARLRFYARFDALALDLPYFQPPVAPGSRREHGMLLAVFDRDGDIATRGRLTPAQTHAVQDYLEVILDDADDPDARRLRRAAAGPDGIRALPLDRYPDVPRSPL